MENINLYDFVKKNESVFIIGASGSGKTTLLSNLYNTSSNDKRSSLFISSPSRDSNSYILSNNISNHVENIDFLDNINISTTNGGELVRIIISSIRDAKITKNTLLIIDDVDACIYPEDFPLFFETLLLIKEKLSLTFVFTSSSIFFFRYLEENLQNSHFLLLKDGEEILCDGKSDIIYKEFFSLLEVL